MADQHPYPQNISADPFFVFGGLLSRKIIETALSQVTLDNSYEIFMVWRGQLKSYHLQNKLRFQKSDLDSLLAPTSTCESEDNQNPAGAKIRG